MSSRRSPIALAALFVVPFVIAAIGAFLIRTNQLEATSPTEPIATPVETTAPAETTAPLTVESTAPVETTTSTEAPIQTTTTTTEPVSVAPDAPISTDGAVLRSIDTSDRRLFDAGVGCASLARDASTVRACDITTTNSVEVAWVSMNEGVDILAHRLDEGPDVWTVVLRSSASASKPPIVADVTGDGENDIVVGWRSEGALATDVVEVVDQSPVVSLHLSLVDGRVTVGDGRLDAWSRIDRGGYAHWGYTGGAERWEAVSELDNDPPSGEL